MSILTLTESEINQLVAVFGNLPLPVLAHYLYSETCFVYFTKSQEEFERQAKVLAYLTYRINDQNTTN